MRYITIALAKGRLADTALDFFEGAGLDCGQMREKSRKLIFTDEKNRFKFILVKAGDVPTYVEYGAADLGVAGRDSLLDSGHNFYELLDLKFGACRMCVAGKPEFADRLSGINNLRVATKYPGIARDYFEFKLHQTIEIIELAGSVELAPLVGLSEVIVDIVESGKTLEENGLVVLDTICSLSARVIANRVSMKTERRRILELIEGLKEHIPVF